MQLMPKLYSWLINQPPTTRSVDFAPICMILALTARLIRPIGIINWDTCKVVIAAVIITQ